MQDFLNAIVDALLWIPVKLYGLLLDGLASVIESIPIPAWVSNAATSAGSVSGDVMYWAEPFNIGYGVGILLSAYGIRFLIRRIPFIG